MVRRGWRAAPAENRSSAVSMAAIRSSIGRTTRTSLSFSRTAIPARTLAQGPSLAAAGVAGRETERAMVGETVGKYRVVSRLGRGGMGTVYKAVDETLDREVAIKCLNADLGDPDLLKRFRGEAVTLARLNHPNIATLFELGDHDGQLMMVMEFVRGETFDKVSQREGPMDVSRAAQLCAQALDALEHAHRAGIVHRDLKPANLMLTQSGLVKVMDFGLARMIGTEHL